MDTARRLKARASQYLSKRHKSSSNNPEVETTTSVPREAPVVHTTNKLTERPFREQQDSAPATSPDWVDIATSVEDAEKALSSAKAPKKHVLKATEVAEPTIEYVESTYELWDPVLQKVQLFASIVEGIGDIHPYAKIATTVLLSVVKPVIAQDKRDKAMRDLLVAMNELYGFVVSTSRLSTIDEDRKNLLKDMLLQTAECAYFIRDHTRAENFCKDVSLSEHGRPGSARESTQYLVP
ncbi:hypothetical protein BD309DRAFT_982922 [Dichomitus squalens]|uniref:Uncharacterized protein n=1 Tax=Dichomitus squalens TaxID=114155 RepID=A0A4V2K398_9APHY|nr:hypothetical protein BD309DRAFT_982922 [Dichomitus squalens]TBU51780.1 hypothetical protein BD310DRAFT_910467 [Dichomitus squalens]